MGGGQLGLNADLTYITTYDVDPGDGGANFVGLNNRNTSFGQLGSVPETRLNVGVDWRTDKHAVNLWVRHIGGYDDSNPANEYDSIDDWTVLDIQYMLSLGVGGGVTDLSIAVIGSEGRIPLGGHRLHTAARYLRYLIPGPLRAQYCRCRRRRIAG